MRTIPCLKSGVAAVAFILGATAWAAPLVGITVGALKGPTGIGMVRLFETPPVLPGNAAIAMVAVPSADLMAAKVISGEYDAAVLPVNVAAKLYAAGVPIRLAAIVGDGMVSFLSSDPSIASIRDLRGKEVQVSGQGATPDYLLQRLLRTAGLDPATDLHLSYALPYPEAAVALASGRIQNAVLPEPFATLARIANPALRSPLDLDALWTASTGQASYPMSAFVVSAALAAERPDAARAILTAYRASIEWVKANPHEAGILVQKNDLGLKAPVAEKSIPRSNFVYRPAARARAAVEALLKVFLDMAPASVGGKLPDDGFYATLE